MRRMDFRHWLAMALLGAVVTAVPGSAQTGCDISAPTSAGIQETFTLCGPTGSSYQYEWYGPGVEIDNDTRCVTARVTEAGTHEFLLILKRNGVEIDRCRHLVNVGGATGGASSCAITGPISIQPGETARLCAPNDGLHSYQWKGPGGFTSTATCVTVGEEGTYYLTSRNRVTGSTRQCTHRLAVVGATTGGCDIEGPTVIDEGTTVRLCAPSRSNVSYRWTGPGQFSATTRCVTVSDPGTYTLRLRNVNSGRTETCSQDLSFHGDVGSENPDDVIYDNCPRDFQFWRGVFVDRNVASRNGITDAELRSIARLMDERSTFFNWGDDVRGAREALAPTNPLTKRKQVARQYAALLANVASGSLNITVGNGESVGLDPDTPVSYSGASTIRALMSVADRTLRASRGNYANLNSTLNAINRGRGIETACE